MKILNTKYDRRYKLTHKQREDIRREYIVDFRTKKWLADKYNITPTQVRYILYPADVKAILERKHERGGWKQYYDKAKHAAEMKKYRKHKKELKKILLKKNET